MVAYCDGSVLAQLGAPDMRTPIAYTLAWPDRIETTVKRLDLAEIGQLTFERPDHEAFPALSLARAALAADGAAPTVLNAANEIAVHAFLAGRIGFLDIVAVVEATLERCLAPAASNLDEVVAVDREARRIATALVGDV
jgi:1-deoxy-D-xylulose-5-phosphate reductoisomerase